MCRFFKRKSVGRSRSPGIGRRHASLRFSAVKRFRQFALRTYGFVKLWDKRRRAYGPPSPYTLRRPKPPTGRACSE